MLTIHLTDTKSALILGAPYMIAFGVVLVLGLIALIVYRKLPEDRKLSIRAHAAAVIVFGLVIAAAIGAIMVPVGKAMVAGAVVPETVPVSETAADVSEEDAQSSAVDVSEGDAQSPAVDVSEEDAQSPAVDMMIEDAAYTTVTEGQDWGPAVTKVILDPGVVLDAGFVCANHFQCGFFYLRGLRTTSAGS